MKHLLILLFLFSFYSCSSLTMQSGKYIRLTSADSLKSLSQKYNAPVWSLREANPGKQFIAGELVLIPLSRGFMGQSRAPASYTPGIYDHFFKSEGFVWPVPNSNRISSDYGHRWGRKHEGIDIPAKIGTKIVAANDGVVVYSGNEYTGYGNIIILGHRDGTFTIYAHNHRNLVESGQVVRRGQQIAQLGNTGRSTGPHLHFEVRKDGVPMNPNRFVARN